MYRVKRKCQNLDGKITDFQKSKEKRKKKILDGAKWKFRKGEEEDEGI